MVICLERGADLHMAQLMPLPLTVSCFRKIQIGFTFLVPAHLGRPGKGPLNRCVCVAMTICTGIITKTTYHIKCISKDQFLTAHATIVLSKSKIWQVFYAASIDVYCSLLGMWLQCFDAVGWTAGRASGL